MKIRKLNIFLLFTWELFISLYVGFFYVAINPILIYFLGIYIIILLVIIGYFWKTISYQKVLNYIISNNLVLLNLFIYGYISLLLISILLGGLFTFSYIYGFDSYFIITPLIIFLIGFYFLKKKNSVLLLYFYILFSTYFIALMGIWFFWGGIGNSILFSYYFLFFPLVIFILGLIEYMFQDNED